MKTTWLDTARKPSSSIVLSASSRQPAWTTGVVTEILGDNRVRVAMPANAPESQRVEAVGPTDGGQTAIGGICQVQLTLDGHIQQVVSPYKIPPNSELVATGVVGQSIHAAALKALEAGELTAEQAEHIQQVKQELVRTQEELDLAMETVTAAADDAVAARQRAIDSYEKAVGAAAAAADAFDAAAAAAGIASGKADIWMDTHEPPESFRGDASLWIDLTDGTNTPRRWDGTSWIAITDATAVMASAAAVSADQKASQALTSADGKSTIYYQMTTPPNPQQGDRWYSLDGTAKIFTGSSWRDTAPGEGYAPALDIGRGTAGELEVGRLKAATSSFALSVIKKLVSDAAFIKELWASKIIVSDSTNLWPNQRFDPDGPLLGIESDETAPMGRARQCSSRDHESQVDFLVTPGEKILVEYTAKRTTGTLDLFVGLSRRGFSGESRWENLATLPAKIADLDGGWSRYSVVTTIVPDTARAALWAFIDQESSGGSTVWHIADVVARRQVGGTMITPESVQAGHLGAKSVTARTLDIVPESGSGGLKMDAQGFDIIPEGGDGTSSISMRADSEQWLSFAKDGKSTLSLDPDGNATFQQIAVREEMTYRGRPLLDVLDLAMPSIEVQGWKYGLGGISLSGSQSEIQVCRASFVMEPGHMYRAFFRGPTLKTTNGSWVECYFRTISSPYKDSDGKVFAPLQAAKTTAVNPYSMVSESVGEYHTPSAETTFGPAVEEQYQSIMVCMRANSAQLLGGADYQAYTFYVQDLGLVGNAAANFTNIWQYSQIYTPPAYQPTNKTGKWSAERSVNNGANGSEYTNTPNRVIQGVVPGYASYGDITGWWRLPNLSAVLSGATINDIQVYVANSHTYMNAGSVSHMRYWDSAGSHALMDAYFSRGEAKWISLRGSGQWEAVAAAVKSGTLGWIGVSGKGSAEYAYFEKDAFQIWVSYTS